MAEETIQPNQEQENDATALIATEGKPSAAQPEVSEAAKKALRKLCKDLGQRDRTARRQEVYNARKARYFYRGDQFLVFDSDRQVWLPYDEGESGGEERKVYNIYFATARSIISALSQDAPGCTFEPKRPNSPVDQDAASAANCIKGYIEKNNDVTDLLAEASRLMFTDGRIAFYSRYVNDGQEFGFSIDEDGKRVPNSGEKVDVFGVLEVSVPITSRKQKHFGWLNLSYEIDINEAKAMVTPDLVDKLSPVGGDSGNDEADGSWERYARVAVQSGVDTDITADMGHLITWSRTWLRPSMFMGLQEADRNELLQMFPDGALVSMLGDQVHEVCGESMDAHWTVALPFPSDGQNGQAAGHSTLPLQETFNELTNQRSENHIYGGAVTWVDPSKVDIDAVNEQRNKPGNHLPIQRDPEEPIASYFYEQPASQISPDLIQFAGEIAGPLLSQISAVSPSLNGIGDKHNETAEGIAQARESALGQLGLVWRAIKKAYASVMAQAVKCATNRTEDVIMTAPGGKETITVCIEDLRAGNVSCTPDTDDSHPQSWSAKRAALLGLMQMDDPAVRAVLTSPANLPLVRDLLGFPDLVIDGANEALKQKQEIGELLASEPIPDVAAIEQVAVQYLQAIQQAEATGQPAPPKPDMSQMLQPSVSIDQDWDDHAIEYQEIRSWVNSPAGQSAKKKNPRGFQNVVLHGMAHKQAMEAEAAKNAPQPQTKPPSESVNFKDLPPFAQMQMLQQLGFQIPQAPAPAQLPPAAQHPQLPPSAMQ